MLPQLPVECPTFAFLDPAANDLHWLTIEKLAKQKVWQSTKTELFILFPYNMSLVRMFSGTTMKFRQVIEKVMPTSSSWRKLHERRISYDISPSELRKKIVEEYRNGLFYLDYKYVPPAKLIKSDKNRPLYFLIFATDHQAGRDIMAHCLNKARSGDQLSWLRYEELY